MVNIQEIKKVESLPRICLNMIVKDEEHCILETLENVYKHIDYYVIVDTGSSDNTKTVIKKFFDSKNIKGDIYDSEFRDFGYARSKALEYCSGKCKYAWVIDADDIVHGDLRFPEDMRSDGYIVRYGKDFVYWRCQIFRSDKKGLGDKPVWHYTGVLHEHPQSTIPNAVVEYLKGDYYIESRRKGARNKVKDKYKKDAAVFEEALKKGDEKNESRYVFYMAQSYYDAGMFEKAMEVYRRRVKIGKWIEEVYCSQFRIAVCMARLGMSLSEIIGEFIKAIQIHPGRAEPYYEISRLFRLNKMYRQAYEYGLLGIPLVYNESYLFCTKSVFDYLLADEVAISSYYVGDYKTAYILSDRILRYKNLPDKYRLRVQINREFARKKLDTVGDKEKPLLVFYTGYSTVFSKKEIYGSELALQSIAKYLKQDYRIVVFSENCELQGFIDGVMSLPARTFLQFQAANDIDILVISRYICFFIEHELRAKKTFIWVHDTTFQSYLNGQRLKDSGKYLIKNIDDKINGYISLTQWHRNVLIQHYRISPNKIFIIGNGLRPELFKNKVDKVPRRFIYTSCPTRGLSLLLKYFQKIHQEFDDAELFVFRGKESFTEEQLDIMKRLPYVHYKGGVSQIRTAIEFQKADVWFYPTIFPETYCMSALEAQMAGCLCISTNFAALSETVSDRGILCNKVYGSEEYEKFMLDKVRDALNGKMEDLRVKARCWAENQTWESMSKKWRGLFQTGSVVQMDAKDVVTPSEKEVVRMSKISFEYPDIRTFVINLDRREDRWRMFKSRADAVGFRKYERVSATDGRTLDLNDKKIKRMFPVDLSTEKKRYESHCRKSGVLGCAISHIDIWRDMIKKTDDDEEVWMILEDDVEFTSLFPKKWPELWKTLKNDNRWDLLYLGYTDHEYKYGDPDVYPGVSRFRGGICRRHGGGTFGYCIRRSAAKYYVNLVDKEGMYRAVDWFMIDQFLNLNCYITLPVMVKSEPYHPQKNSDSDVHN